MDERVGRWEIAGLILTLLAGNLLHFVYEWSGRSPVAAAFAAVNESTWEHMKLLAVPWILWTLVEVLALGKDGVALLPGRGLGLLAGLAAIPALFYTYRGVTGQNFHMVNILIFQVAVLLAFAVSGRIRKSGRLQGRGWQFLGAAILLCVGALFLRWTYHTPELPLFVDGRTGQAGIPK